MIKLKFIICWFLTLILGAHYSVAQNIDSLIIEIKNSKPDTNKLRVLTKAVELINDDEKASIYNTQLEELSKKLILSQNSIIQTTAKKYYAVALSNTGFFLKNKSEFDKAFECWNKCLKIQKEINDKQGISTTLNNIGYYYSSKGDALNALEYFQNSLKIQQEINDQEGMAYSINNIASILKNQGNIVKALDYYMKALAIQERLKDKNQIANTFTNLGMIYFSQGEITKAIEYINKSLALKTDIDDKIGMASSYNNLGLIYKSRNNYMKSLECFEKSLKLAEDVGNKKGISTYLNNIANLFLVEGDLERSLEYSNRSLKISEEILNKGGIINSSINIASVFHKKQNTPEALKYGEKALKLAIELGIPDNIKAAALLLKNIYKDTGNSKRELQMFELYIQMKDSLNNEVNKKAAIKTQINYEYEKKVTADSVKIAEEKLITASQLKQEQTQRYALYGGLFLFSIFSVFIYNRFRVTQKQKHIIFEQKLIVEHQKELVEEKHKEITDSINYAERIQRSFLASKNLLDENLASNKSASQSYFVFFQPKDVVSGDFYWASKLNNGNFVLVTADSTGHGVPGAIMSLLNITSLESAIKDGNIEPDTILNETRKTIIERLKKDGSIDGGKDGMDCSCIILNSQKTILSYSAANNPVWIVRNGIELIELSPDKMPVGKHDKDSVSFTKHDVNLQKGDIIYTLTDGMPDQFGGPKGKKFMYKKLKEFLISISQLPMNEQNSALNDSLANWKGDLEQVDDVCLIGIKI